MQLKALLAGLLVAATLAACSKEPAAPTLDLAGEASLAANLSGTADAVGRAHGSTLDLILRHFFAALRENDNPDARALLAESRVLAEEGREAMRAGDRETARAKFEAAHQKLFEAIVLVLPDAAERTGGAVDEAAARITERLGDREAPRIRRVLALVADIRARANAALAEGNEGRALALNIRALDILRALRHHLSHPGGRGLPGDQGSQPPPSMP
jgi:hypothetical protein